MVATDTKLLVLGLGSTLLRDDGIGLLLLRAVEERAEPHWRDRVDFVHAGTRLLEVLPDLADRPGLVILSVVEAGGKAGTVHVLTRDQLDRLGVTGNACELIAAARCRGECPDTVYLIGVEPDAVRTGLGVSDPVAKVLHRAVDQAVSIVEILLAQAAAESKSEPDFVFSYRAAEV